MPQQTILQMIQQMKLQMAQQNILQMILQMPQQMILQAKAENWTLTARRIRKAERRRMSAKCGI